MFVVGSGGTTAPEVYGRADVTPTGEVLWWAGGVGELEFMSLESISFWADS